MSMEEAEASLRNQLINDKKAEKIMAELEGKKFTVSVYKETDYRQDKIYEQKSFVPEFKKMPVELTMKYFEE